MRLHIHVRLRGRHWRPVDLFLYSSHRLWVGRCIRHIRIVRIVHGWIIVVVFLVILSSVVSINPGWIRSRSICIRVRILNRYIFWIWWWYPLAASSPQHVMCRIRGIRIGRTRWKVFSLHFFLEFHSSVLKPDFYLTFSQV